jgi:hypothetical protein
MSGNSGDMKSPDMPMMTVSDIFNTSMMNNQVMTNSINITPEVSNRTGMESVNSNGAIRS